MSTSSETNGGRSRAYEALRESEELHRATLSSISDAVFMTDDEGTFTYICPNVDVIFGYVPDEVQAMGTIGRLLGEQLFERSELAARHEIRNIEREVVSKSGARRTVLIHVKAVAIRGGTVLYTCRDVTERRHAEDELRATRLDLAHASRLALVGELVASIIHEVSQPLTAIISNATAGLHVLDREPVDVRTLRDVVASIRSQAATGGDVVDRLRTLARKRPLEMRTLQINRVVHDVLRLVESDARRRHVTLEARLDPALPTVKADRVSLQQVLLNLIVNAMDALDGADSGNRFVTVTSREAAGRVEIAVSDTGNGIPVDHLPRLFDAFYTTKQEGIGLGLAIARSLVEAHDGSIWADNDSSGGATFCLTLPAS